MSYEQLLELQSKIGSVPKATKVSRFDLPTRIYDNASDPNKVKKIVENSWKILRKIAKNC